jgi:hypothetical protein
MTDPETTFEATLVYDEALVREAVFGFWWRSVQRRTLVAWAISAALVAWLWSTGDRSWLVGLLGAALLFSAAMIAAVYHVHRANAMRRLADMGAPTAILTAGADSFTVMSGAGSSTLPWSAIREVWQLERCWLLLLSKAQFMTLPLATVPEEMRRFIAARVAAAGGAISQ